MNKKQKLKVLWTIQYIQNSLDYAVNDLNRLKKILKKELRGVKI